MQKVIIVQPMFGERFVSDLIEIPSHMTLDALWEALNGQGENHVLRKKIHYSLSVGDYIFYRERWYRVASVNFEIVEWSEVIASIDPNRDPMRYR